MYVSKRFTHELENVSEEELRKQGIKVKKDRNGKLYAVNPTRKQLEWLARRNALKGVCVVYDYGEQRYKVLPKPAAILCNLAGTCRIIKEFKSSTEALDYLKKL